MEKYSLEEQTKNNNQLHELTEAMNKPNFLSQLHYFNTQSNYKNKYNPNDLHNSKIFENEYSTYKLKNDTNLYNEFLRNSINHMPLNINKDKIKKSNKLIKRIYKEQDPEYINSFNILKKKMNKKLREWILEYKDIFEYIEIRKDKPKLIADINKKDLTNNDKIKYLFIYKIIKKNNLIEILLKKYLRKKKFTPEEITNKQYDDIKDFYYLKLKKLFIKKIYHQKKYFK